MSVDPSAIHYMLQLIRDGAGYSVSVGTDRIVWVSVEIPDNIANADEPFCHVVGIKSTVEPQC